MAPRTSRWTTLLSTVDHSQGPAPIVHLKLEPLLRIMFAHLVLMGPTHLSLEVQNDSEQKKISLYKWGGNMAFRKDFGASPAQRFQEGE